MIGTQVRDADGVAEAALAGHVDAEAWDSFIARHMAACDGRASERFVERFLPVPDRWPPGPNPVGRAAAGSGSPGRRAGE